MAGSHLKFMLEMTEGYIRRTRRKVLVVASPSVFVALQVYSPVSCTVALRIVNVVVVLSKVSCIRELDVSGWSL